MVAPMGGEPLYRVPYDLTISFRLVGRPENRATGGSPPVNRTAAYNNSSPDKHRADAASLRE